MRAKATTTASPSILVPPTIELLRLSELARQGVHRLGSLVHYVGAERVKPPGQRVGVVDRGAEPALHPIEPHAREDERVVALEDLEPRDDAVRADAVVPAVRSHESENLVPVAAREQRDAVGVARDPEVLLRAEQIESLLEEARLRRSHESLRARRRMRRRRSTLNGGSACQVITHALVNVGRYTPARWSRRHAPASTCSVSSRTIAAPRNRAGSVWCSNGTRSLPRQWSSRYARLMRHNRAGSRTIGSRTTTRD